MNLILQTNRCILREFNLQDSHDFYQLNLNPNVIQYTGDQPFEIEKDAQDFLKNYSDYQRNGYGRWAVISKENSEFLGWCGLKFNGTETDIGFRFFEKNWNKGYATETADACLKFGFETLALKEILGRAMKENLASIRVLEKIGMVYDKEIDFDLHPGVQYKITQ